jgi:4-carboxymuconolactone decarboxylase
MIPKPYRQMHQLYPDFMGAYESFAEAARHAGPLSEREVALVKLAISVGAGLEGAAHSHCRKALDAGCRPDDLRHVALLAAPTIGFPTMMRARGWIQDIVGEATADAAQPEQAAVGSIGKPSPQAVQTKASEQEDGGRSSSRPPQQQQQQQQQQ